MEIESIRLNLPSPREPQIKMSPQRRNVIPGPYPDRGLGSTRSPSLVLARLHTAPSPQAIFLKPIAAAMRIAGAL